MFSFSMIDSEEKKNMIKITTDSTCDLPKKLLEENNISVLPLIVTLGDEEFFDNGKDISQEVIFDFVKRTKTLPKTAARSVMDFVDFFKPFVDNGDTVIHIGIGADLSSCHRNAVLASDEIGGDKVVILDSKALSSGVGLLALEASKMAKEGKSVQEICAEIERLSSIAQVSFVVDRLDFLYKGGRCSRFSFSMGAMLKIKPRLQVIDGKMINTAKDMGPMKVVLKKYIDAMLEKYPNVKKERCFLAHTKMDENLLKEIVEYVKSKNIFDEVIPQDAGSVITSHCGEGTLGMLYLCD